MYIMKVDPASLLIVTSKHSDDNKQWINKKHNNKEKVIKVWKVKVINIPIIAINKLGRSCAKLSSSWGLLSQLTGYPTYTYLSCLLNYPASYWYSATIFAKQVLLISNCFTTSLDGLVGGLVGAGLSKIKANSASS